MMKAFIQDLGIILLEDSSSDSGTLLQHYIIHLFLSVLKSFPRELERIQDLGYLNLLLSEKFFLLNFPSQNPSALTLIQIIKDYTDQQSREAGKSQNEVEAKTIQENIRDKDSDIIAGEERQKINSNEFSHMSIKEMKDADKNEQQEISFLEDETEKGLGPNVQTSVREEAENDLPEEINQRGKIVSTDNGSGKERENPWEEGSTENKLIGVQNLSPKIELEDSEISSSSENLKRASQAKSNLSNADKNLPILLEQNTEEDLVSEKISDDKEGSTLEVRDKPNEESDFPISEGGQSLESSFLDNIMREGILSHCSSSTLSLLPHHRILHLPTENSCTTIFHEWSI